MVDEYGYIFEDGRNGTDNRLIDLHMEVSHQKKWYIGLKIEVYQPWPLLITITWRE